MTEKSRAERPSTGELPGRTVHIDQDTWDLAADLAEVENSTVSAVIAKLLRERLARQQDRLAPGHYLDVPCAALEIDLPPRHVVTHAFAGLCVRLTGFLPSEAWTADDITRYIDQAVAGRIPAGHFFGLAEGPNPSSGMQSFGIWPG